MRVLWSKRMSSTDVRRPADVRASEHATLWTIGLSALLIAFGFARRRSEDASPATGDRRQSEAAHGRSAETPSQIPARGWKDILLRVYHGISEDRILLVATGVTFYALLAIFPGIAGSARPSLLFFTEQRISAGRR
jgi:membrane protein